MHFRCNAYRLHFSYSLLFWHSSHSPLHSKCVWISYSYFSDVRAEKTPWLQKSTITIPKNEPKCAVIFVKQQLKNTNNNEKKEKCNTVREVNRIMDFYSHKPKTEILTWFLWQAIINNPAKELWSFWLASHSTHNHVFHWMKCKYDVQIEKESERLRDNHRKTNSFVLATKLNTIVSTQKKNWGEQA